MTSETLAPEREWVTAKRCLIFLIISHHSHISGVTYNQGGWRASCSVRVVPWSGGASRPRSESQRSYHRADHHRPRLCLTRGGASQPRPRIFNMGWSSQDSGSITEGAALAWADAHMSTEILPSSSVILQVRRAQPAQPSEEFNGGSVVKGSR